MNQENRYHYRICYTKGERVKYISHLDFLRCINRSFKRAHIPVKYSQGFNPHVLLNIALPCPVGVSSECELLDIELKEPMDCLKIKEALQRALPVGIDIITVAPRGDSADFYDICSASYEISFLSDKEIDISAFASEESIIIEKKSKRGMKEVNLMDYIHSISLDSSDGTQYKITATIDAGARSNLKSELMLGAMQKYFGASFTNIYQHRKAIYFS